MYILVNLRFSEKTTSIIGFEIRIVTVTESGKVEPDHYWVSRYLYF